MIAAESLKAKGAADKPEEAKHAVRRLGEVGILTYPAKLALGGSTVGAMRTLEDGGPDWRVCEGPVGGKSCRLLLLRSEVPFNAVLTPFEAVLTLRPAI